MPEIVGAGRRKVGRGRHGVTLEPVADRVWLVRGGFPRKVMNVYLIEDDDGLTAFDAGIGDMVEGIEAAAAEVGGEVKRVVLGHAHEDHRGAAPGLGAQVLCHVDEVRYAESPVDPMTDYFDISKLEKRGVRFLMPRFLAAWDEGPVKVADSLSEGDEVAGFRVVHVPGHAPGLIVLWRESDRLALASDTFYTLDPESYVSRFGPPRVPHPAFNLDTEQARESIRKLAAMEPASAWPGHADPLVGDVRAQLERAAATT
jgi:glyoxylase-like metal-dependent hydrolase (beta-lactamase superfamily II)